MSFDPPTDHASWSLPGASVTPVLPEDEQLCVTPLLDLLRAAAEINPDAVAMVGLNAGLSFSDLLRLVQNTARAIAKHTRPTEAVACILPRTPESIAALLGCLIAGRPCMVLDPAQPAQRREALLKDAAPALLLSLEPCHSGPSLLLRDALSGPGEPWQPDQVWDPDAPFAIHFTSGSTGRPKGVVLSARSVLYRGVFAARTLRVTSASRVTQPTSPVSSGGLSMLLGALAVGSRVVLADVAAEGAGNTLKLIEREAVTTAVFVPAVMRMLMSLQRARSAFRTTRSVRLGAGSVTWADVREWRTVLPDNCIIEHAYASTEALTMAQWIVPENSAHKELRVPAGMPHFCHEYAILDEHGRPVPPGEPGELVVRGQYVALGEWRDGALVPGRMLPVPGQPSWRMFRTGDVVRVHPDGMLRVVGRVDRQVKINGVLVQPAEIEAVLKAEPRVTDAAVVARNTPAGIVLHGYVAAPDADPKTLVVALRRRLAVSLPMVFRPPHLVVLDTLPALPGGKIDLIALTRLAGSEAPRRDRSPR